jgi:hypothetical protein
MLLSLLFLSLMLGLGHSLVVATRIGMCEDDCLVKHAVLVQHSILTRLEVAPR